MNRFIRSNPRSLLRSMLPASVYLLAALTFSMLSTLDARNPRFAFIGGGEFETGADPGALLAVPRDSSGKRAPGDLLFITSYRENTVMRAGRNEAGFVGPINAAFWDNRDFKGKRQTRKIDAIDFDWGNDAPLPGFGADTFSARMTGEFRADRSGRYRFTTESDDGVRLWINDQKIIDRWHDMAPAFHSGEIELEGGRVYKLRLDYYENGGGAMVRLFWQAPGASKRSLMRRLGGFAPDAGGNLEVGLGPRAIASGDVNGDGRTDLAVANYNFAGTVTLLLSNDDGGFEISSIGPVGDDPIDLALRDLDGDGHPELIVLNRSSADLSVFAHSGDPKKAFNQNEAPAQRIALPRGSGDPRQQAVADLDRDSRPDLLVLAGDLFVYRGVKAAEPNASDSAGAAAYLESTPRRIAIGDSKTVATSFAAADFDQDGDRDIALGLREAGGLRPYLRLMRNTNADQLKFEFSGAALAPRSATIPAPADDAIFPGAVVLRAGDIDGDGKVDFALGDPGSPRLFLFQNRSGKGRLSTKSLRLLPAISLPAPVTDLGLADLNGDGKVDLAALHAARAKASIYFAR
ncbi:MAG: FG-GAP-like repeat-containing protein [bacterium]|nr:FG-GAP-like repeat-containing protein [bacterium]